MNSEDLLNHITHLDDTQTTLLLANLVKVHIKKPFIPLFLQLAQKNFKFFTNYSIDYLGILNHTPSLFQRDLTNYLEKIEVEIEKKHKIILHNYETYFSKKKPTHQIPKIIHQIWMGGDIPEQYTKYMDSWKRHHPDWDYKLWNDNDIPSYDFINKEAFTKAKNFGTKSDLWRYDILYKYGGLYVDVDVECLKPIDDLHNCFDWYAGHCIVGLETALIGSKKNHPFMHQLNHSLDHAFLANINTVHDVLISTGPIYLTKVFFSQKKSWLNNAQFMIFPSDYFSPFSFIEVTKKKPASWPPDELHSKIKKSYAIHYFGSNWIDVFQ